MSLTKEDAMYHILNTIVKCEDEDWMLDKHFAETTMQEILRPGYWADQLNAGLPDLPHSRFMKPFCRQMLNIPKSPNKLGTSEHLVCLVSSLQLLTLERSIPLNTQDAIYALGNWCAV
jgi:hypothetical protein